MFIVQRNSIKSPIFENVSRFKREQLIKWFGSINATPMNGQNQKLTKLMVCRYKTSVREGRSAGGQWMCEKWGKNKIEICRSRIFIGRVFGAFRKLEA